MNNEIFAKRFKELRFNKGVTQTEISQYLGVTKAAISYYESGRRVPSHSMIKKIANYFKVPSDYLLGMDYILEDSNDEYLRDEVLLRIIRRSPSLCSFILADPRTNVRVLEDFINRRGN